LYIHQDIYIRSRAVTNSDYSALEKVSESAIKEKQKFERLVVSKETLLEMFTVRSISLSRHHTYLQLVQYNKYKTHLIETKIPDGTSTTVYRCGPMVDLCVGPHIPHTGKIKAFMVTKVSSKLLVIIKQRQTDTKM
jgi:threonyl-tRNA synthetase